MRRSTAVASMAGLILFGSAMLVAANNAIEGRWRWTTDTPDSGPAEWTTTFKVQDGKLTGTAEGEPGQFELTNLKMNGDTLSGDIEVEGDKYTFEVTVTGDKLEGKWKMEGLSGSIKGVREPDK